MLSSENISCNGAADGQISILGLSNGNPIASVQWSANVGNQSGNAAIGLDPGVYQVDVTDLNGCTVSTEVIITEPSPIIISFNIAPVLCLDPNSGAIQADVSGGLGPYSINWSNGGNGSTINNLSEGNYTINVTDDNGCTAEADVLLESQNTLNGEVLVEQTSCAGNDARISAIAAGDAGPFSYSIDGGQSFVQEPLWTDLNPGTYSVLIRDQDGCEWSQGGIEILEAADFMIELGDDLVIELGDSIQMNPQIFSNSTTFIFDWRGQIPSDLSCADCQQPWFRPSQSTRLFLEVFDENGCEASDNIFVRVINPFFIEVPTGFSPNDDGNNDLLIVHGYPDALVRELRVYDRLGELVYLGEELTTNSKSQGWDGTWKGEKCPAGVYIWTAEAEFSDGSIRNYHGHVTLLR
jgi:gliding motility-associated-like protein